MGSKDLINNKMPIKQVKPVSFRAQAKRARDLGQNTFIADRECLRGHYERRSRDGGCIECNKMDGYNYYRIKLASRTPEETVAVRAQNAIYSANYRRDHPEKVHFFVRRWQKTHRPEMKIISTRHYDKKKKESSND
jgi:hypothetical protein